MSKRKASKDAESTSSEGAGDVAKAQPETVAAEAAEVAAETVAEAQTETSDAEADVDVDALLGGDAESLTPKQAKALRKRLKEIEQKAKEVEKAEREQLAASEEVFLEVLNLTAETVETAGFDKVKAALAAVPKGAGDVLPSATRSLRYRDSRLSYLSRGRRDGGKDERDRLNESDIVRAGLQNFNGPDGNAVSYFKGTESKPAHPRAYLDAYAPENCYYERACPIAEQAIEASGAKSVADSPPESLLKHLGKEELTPKQAEDVRTLGDLHHGDAASRAFVKKAITDTTATVLLKDGSTQSVAEFVKDAIKVQPAELDADDAN